MDYLNFKSLPYGHLGKVDNTKTNLDLWMMSVMYTVETKNCLLLEQRGQIN